MSNMRPIGRMRSFAGTPAACTKDTALQRFSEKSPRVGTHSRDEEEGPPPSCGQETEKQQQQHTCCSSSGTSSRWPALLLRLLSAASAPSWLAGEVAVRCWRNPGLLPRLSSLSPPLGQRRRSLALPGPPSSPHCPLSKWARYFCSITGSQVSHAASTPFPARPQRLKVSVQVWGCL